MSSAGQFYTIDENRDALCTIDVNTGAVNIVGSLGISYSFGDIAYDSSTNTMYLTDGGVKAPAIQTSIQSISRPARQLWWVQWAQEAFLGSHMIQIQIV